MDFALGVLKVLAENSESIVFEFRWRVFELFMRKNDDAALNKIRHHAARQHR